LYATTAWGQIDSIVALLSLAGILLVYSGKKILAPLLLGLAVCFKPIAIPVALTAIIWLLGRSFRSTVFFVLVFTCAVFLFCVPPFFLPGWDPGVILGHWNAHFTMAGGMSYLTFVELLKNTYQLPWPWTRLGMAWVPMLALAGLIAARRMSRDLPGLLQTTAGLALVFFLSRTWLSEPNIVLVLPFILILSLTGKLPKQALLLVWVLPLVFGIFNLSEVQLLFPVLGEKMAPLLKLLDTFRTPRLLLRTIVVIPWLVVGTWITLVCLRLIKTGQVKNADSSPELAGQNNDNHK
jgi:hypothetical protein